MKAYPKLGVFMLCINCLSLGLGVVHLLYGKANAFWNVYGFLMLSTFLSNTLLAFWEKDSPRLGKAYLAASFIFMLVLPFSNTLPSIIPSNFDSQSRLSVIMIFSLFILGAFMGYKRLRHKQKGISANRTDWQHDTGKVKLIRRLVMALLSLILLSGLYIVFNLLSKDKDGVFEILVPEYSLFYAVAFLSLGLLIMKLGGERKRSLYNYGVLGVTMLIFVVCMVPFASMPLLLQDAEEEYKAAFGEAWISDADFESGFFRQVPFSLAEYFYGTQSKEYRLQENVLFYEGNEGVDKGLVLSFDVYSPPKDKSILQGGSSVLIRIHGGGWTVGDKGVGNFAQMNKYFASQGYAVFDIQYGLSNKEKFIKFAPVPRTRLGDFTMDDMVRHIGIFSTYLADHQDEYNINLDSVFISGGSAGGHLTLASGLGLHSGKYSDILEPRLKVKGLIPFYPANGLSRNLKIDGSDAMVNPTALVEKDSPPCLIYQGSHDGLVPPLVALGFKDEYIDKGNERCAVLNMLFGSHSSDLYFAGYYNQVFLYYMERFMYQYRG